MRPIYNPLDLARAIPFVVDQVPQAGFVIRVYGPDPELLAAFKAIIQEHHVEAHVHYVGEQSSDEDIADLNRMVDVVVSVPSSDGTPLSVLEAMACGTAVVLSDLPSLREWVQDGSEGLFVPVGDVTALSQAIVRLLQDTALRQRLQLNGQELVRQRADRQVWMTRAEEMYQKLITHGE
jgi:glycosyltransferase involved in cell wall biosynthesis